MNDCYWGGVDDNFYYDCESGWIIGEIRQLEDGTWESTYIDWWSGPKVGRFIDAARARKSIERMRKHDVEHWKRQQEAWNAPATFEEEPVETSRKSWWKIWE